MPQKKGALDQIRDRLQANRNRLTYVLLLLGGLLGLAGWALLPEVVAIHAQQAANIGKNTILLADLALTWGFTAAFWVRPREIIYFVAACLGAFLSLRVLIINVML